MKLVKHLKLESVNNLFLRLKQVLKRKKNKLHLDFCCSPRRFKQALKASSRSSRASRRTSVTCQPCRGCGSTCSSSSSSPRRWGRATRRSSCRSCGDSSSPLPGMDVFLPDIAFTEDGTRIKAARFYVQSTWWVKAHLHWDNFGKRTRKHIFSLISVAVQCEH